MHARCLAALAVCGGAAAQQRCGALRDEVVLGDAEAAALRLRPAAGDAAAPYAIAGGAPASPGSAACDRPAVGDALVRAGDAVVFDGSLQDAIDAWAGGGVLSTETFAFPLVDGGLAGFAIVRFEAATARRPVPDPPPPCFRRPRRAATRPRARRRCR